jgi:hypothetical protein
MKTNFASRNKFHATILVGLLLGAVTPLSHAAPAPSPSPAGTNSFTWDCITSGGGQPGITILTFSNDYTFSGYALVAGVPPANNNSGGRNGGGASRGGSSTSAGKANSTIFGSGPISGLWGFDVHGKVIGFFTEAINTTSSVTNYSIDCPPDIVIPFLVTNADLTMYPSQTNFSVPCFTEQALTVMNTWTATSTNDGTPNFYTQVTTIDNTNFTVVAGTAESTNAVSFTGTVVSGKRLTLVASSSFGKVTYTGVPLKTSLTDLTGNWYGNKKQGGQSSIEFFNLTASSTPNIYFMDGQGPGYAYTNGICVLSARNKIGFSLAEGGTDLRATFGSFQIKNSVPTAHTKGILGSSDAAISFDAAKLP